MSIKNMLRSKKGISPILATLLLIVIAVAAIVVTYAWVMTYMGTAGQQAGVILYKANVSFYMDAGTDKIDVDVGNSGTSKTEIIKIYVGTTSSNMTEQTPSPSPPISLSGKSITKITITYDWTAGTTYYFRIVSSTGQTLEFPEAAPS